MKTFGTLLLLPVFAALLSCGTEPMRCGTETGNGTAGRVVGLTGKPVAGARVTLVPAGYNELEPPPGSFMLCSGQTDSMGRYLFVNVLAGRYNLFADSGANKAYRDSIYISGNPGDTIGKIALEKCGSIAGTALYSSGRSLENGYIVLEGSRIYAPVSASDGSFFFQDLAPGAYLAKAVTRSNGYFDIPVTLTIGEGQSDTLRNPFLLISSSVTALASDTSGVWIGTTNGLACLSNGAWRAYGLYDGLSSSRINCINVDKSGTIWIGTSLRLARIRNDSLTENLTSLSYPPITDITALASDSTGNLWFGTPQGLFLYGKAGVNQITSNDALIAGGLGSSQNELTAVTAILCLQQEIMVGTMHGMYWRDSANVWNTIDELNDFAVSSMVGSGKDSVWIGTNQGLRLWNRTSKTLSAPSDSMQAGAITCLAASGGDSLYAGGANGLFLYCESRFVNIDLGASGSNISAIAIDSRGVLWVGTNEGIVRIENGQTEIIR
ncbi:MAG TPA: two-component regulator propeller domain-containing protein [Chitinivibrionales bacterium]|nr:two-component regulator propeller domain-containing protein [Chitinivibrionales bacterium]